MRAASWVGSIAVHGALAVMLAMRCEAPRPPASTEIVRDIEVVEQVARTESSVEGRGSRAGAPEAAVERKAGGRARRAAARRAESDAEPTVTPGSGAGGGDGIGEGDGNGDGDGNGNGDGSGAIGGTLGRLAIAPRTLERADVPTPRPPPPSKARPPRLIWPKQDRPEEPDRIFAATLTIDEEGYVVGVRLTRGTTGPQSERAQSAVWRFRYDPALDDDGHPVRARLEQKFMLE